MNSENKSWIYSQSVEGSAKIGGENKMGENKPATVKTTPTPWRIVERDPQSIIAIGIEHASKPSCVEVVADFHTPECAGFADVETIKANAELIVRAVNEHAALCAVAEAAKEIIVLSQDPAGSTFTLREIFGYGNITSSEYEGKRFIQALANLDAVRKGE